MVILPSGPNASQPGNGPPSPRSPPRVMQWDGRACYHVAITPQNRLSEAHARPATAGGAGSTL